MVVDFAGFEMPVRYQGDKAEHMAVRTGVGLFDVSHMGEVFIEGERAMDAVQRLFTNDATKIVDGQAMYAGLLYENGTFVDDCVVYRFSPTRFLVCVNASNREKDFTYIRTVVEREFTGVVARDDTDKWAQIAVQGPRACALVVSLTDDRAGALGNYYFREGTIQTAKGPVSGIIARTGYTGEDGFELYVPSEVGPALWDILVERGGVPCGLGARDTLRLEAGMALYGNDIDDQHTPLEAGLNFIVKLDKTVDFIGAAALRAQKASGVKRRLRGIEMGERGIPRHGYTLHDAAGAQIGVVTSGTHAPFLDRPIAMAYVDDAHSAFDTPVFVDVRGKKLKATVAKLPFYKRKKESS
jgi:aminomethyltransferase